jgi:hypothetical protein
MLCAVMQGWTQTLSLLSDKVTSDSVRLLMFGQQERVTRTQLEKRVQLNNTLSSVGHTRRV